MKKYYLGHLNTPNFDFYVMAETKKEMFEQLKTAWNKHAYKTGATWKWQDLVSSVYWLRLPLNEVKRR